MRWIALAVVLFLAGCVPGRTTFIVSGEVEEVAFQAQYELGGNQRARSIAENWRTDSDWR